GTDCNKGVEATPRSKVQEQVELQFPDRFDRGKRAEHRQLDYFVGTVQHAGSFVIARSRQENDPCLRIGRPQIREWTTHQNRVAEGRSVQQAYLVNLPRNGSFPSTLPSQKYQRYSQIAIQQARSATATSWQLGRKSAQAITTAG